MSHASVLYMKGANMTDSDEDMEEDIWDDRKLNDAYDKALKMANLEVAKRVAMATNSVDRKKDKSGETSEAQHNQVRAAKQQKKSKQNKSQKKALKEEPKHLWKEGMPCRARYDADGFEYEAIVLTILDEENCVVRYLGYNNTEIVPIASLQPTLGKQARKDQMMEAITDREEEEFSTHSSHVENGFAENTHPARGMDALPQQANRRSRKVKRSSFEQCFQMPNIPMPDLSMLREFGVMDMPTPPPPPMLGAQGDDQALSNMLVSWYMSGYYTGLYQGMKRSRARQRDC